MAISSHRRDEAAVRLMTSFACVNGSVFVGYVVDPAELERRFSLELLIDGVVVQTAYADRFSAELSPSVGDRCYGFVIRVAASLLTDANLVEARVANLGHPIGFLAIGGSDLPQPADNAIVTSRVRWLGGLRFRGWIAEVDPSTPLKVAVNGQDVMELDNLPWAQADEDAFLEQPVRGFDFHLPERFADGCVKRLTVIKANGEALAGLPLAFVAFPDGLAATIARFGSLESERLRAELYDHLVPASLPFTAYREWKERFPIPSGHRRDLKASIVILGMAQLERTHESLERQSLLQWTACAIGSASDTSTLDAEEALGFLDNDGRDCDFVVFAPAGTEFASSALQRIAACFAADDHARAVYGDLELISADGSLWPLAFPAFDYERLLEQGYCAHVFALRRSVATRQLATSPNTLLRLFNSIFDDGMISPDQSVVHLPGAIAVIAPFALDVASSALQDATIAHLTARGMDAQVAIKPSTLLPAIRVHRTKPNGRTTIVIPTRNRVELLQACLDSLHPVLASSDVDLIVVDNDSIEEKTLRYLTRLREKRRARVLAVPGPFNYARLNNLAAQETDADFLLFLNNDVIALDGTWFDEMGSRLAEPDVGAVGALLAWPSGMVQHGGVVLGPGFAATHAFNDRMLEDAGYTDLLRVAHECSAVTAACLLTRRKDYLELGGMDEIHFPVSFNDVDYCLRLRTTSRRIIMTPHARLVHLESASRGRLTSSDHAARFARELTALRHRWGEVLLRDPFYNPMLSLDPIPYSALAWPARPCDPRLPVPIKARDIPAGF